MFMTNPKFNMMKTKWLKMVFYSKSLPIRVLTTSLHVKNCQVSLINSLIDRVDVSYHYN